MFLKTMDEIVQREDHNVDEQKVSNSRSWHWLEKNVNTDIKGDNVSEFEMGWWINWEDLFEYHLKSVIEWFGLYF